MPVCAILINMVLASLRLAVAFILSLYTISILFRVYLFHNRGFDAMNFNRTVLHVIDIIKVPRFYEII